MTDIRLYQRIDDLPTVAVTFDWLLTPIGTFDTSQELVTAVIVALGTDRLAEDDDILPGFDDTDRRGWWGDTDAEILHDGWPIGTRLWLLWRHKITGERAQQGSSTARAREYAYEALQPLIERGICADIEVSAVRSGIDKIDVEITLIRGPEPNLTLRYASLWNEIKNPPYPPLVVPPPPPAIPLFGGLSATLNSLTLLAVGGPPPAPAVGTLAKTFGTLTLVATGGSAAVIGALNVALGGVSRLDNVIDLTQASSITTTRTGEVMVATSDITAAIIPANTPIIEFRDGELGTWTSEAVTNEVPSDFYTGGDSSGSPITVTTGFTDPAGGTTAIRLTDASTSSAHWEFYGFWLLGSLWIREDAADLPTSPGGFAMHNGFVDGYVEPISGTSWTRYELGPLPGGGLGNVLQVHPAGAAPGGVFIPSATGSVFCAFAFTCWLASYYDVPTAKTSISAAGIQLTSTQRAKIVQDGTLDITVRLLPGTLGGLGGFASTTLWSANSGAHSLRTDASGNLILKIGGTDRLTANQVASGVAGTQQLGIRGQRVDIRTWFDPIRNESGIRVSVGGVVAFDTLGTASGAPLAALTDFWLGCNDGTSGFATLRYQRVLARKSAPRAITPGVFLGGNAMASAAASGLPSVPSFVFTTASDTARGRCLAVPGETIANQKTRWQALSTTERSSAPFIVIHVGLNDLFTPAETGATVIARLQDLVSTVAADKGSGDPIIIGGLTPCKQRLIDVLGATDGASAYTKWGLINEAIAGGGATPITGAAARVTAYVTTLNDGSGNLIASFDNGDHITPNIGGRQVIADDYATALAGLGIST